MKIKKLLLTAFCAVLSVGAWAQEDVTSSYIEVQVCGSSGWHASCNNKHKMSDGIGWYNTQTLNGDHAFNAPNGSTAGESWSPNKGTSGIMMGRTIVLPAGKYTLSFSAFGTTATNASDPTAATAGDVVAFCTGKNNIDITNTTVGGSDFHNVTFDINVVAPTTTIEFGIKKLTNDSKPDWCQIKDVKLTQNSSDIVAIPNNSLDGWSITPATDGFKVNTWSTEGQSDGTAFQVPFIQNWLSKGNKLADATIKKSFTPTKAGIYKVTAWVRPKNEAGGNPSGVTMFAGDAKVDVCKSSLGTYSTFVKAEANVAFDYGFEIKDATVNWLSFKNVTIEYVGTGADGSDLTGAIVNNDFLNCENGKFPGWNIEAPNGGNTWKNGDSKVEYWIGTAASGKFDYYQTINNLPNGKYKVSARMWNSMNGVAGTFAPTSGVYANNVATTVWGLVDTDCDAGSMVDKESDLITVTGSLRVGVANKETMVARWFGVDWIKLTLVEEIKAEDVRSNIEALLTTANSIKDEKQKTSIASEINTAITNAEGYESNENVEQLVKIANDLTAAIEVSQPSIGAYAALKTELDKDYFCDRSTAFTTAFTYRTEAQTMYDEATAATADVNAKASGMVNAYRNYVKAIAANYPTVEGVKGARDENAWVFTTDPTNKGNYNNKANNDIAANVMRENWKGNGLTGDMKQTVSVPNGKYFLRMVSFTRKSPNANDYIYIKSGEATETSVTFGTGDNPFVNITNPIEVTNGEVEIGLHVGSGADWAAIGGVVLYAMEIDDYKRTTANEKYGTICLPYAATVEGANIYSASINEDKTAVTLEAVEGDLVAGTPYIYQATADAQTFSYKEGNVVAAPVAADPLVGSFVDKSVDVDNYILQTQGEVQAFYKVVANHPVTCLAYHCYLAAPADGARLTINIDGEETGINELGTENGSVADGKYMQNNKVVIVKNGRKYNVTGQLVK